MRLKKLVFITALITMALAQVPVVVNIMPVSAAGNREFHYPQFSPDDACLLLTTANFQGLFEYDLGSGKLRTITAQQGAGFGAVYSTDGQTIYYRENNRKNHRNYFSLVRFDRFSAAATILVKEQRELSVPQRLSSGAVVYSLDEVVRSVDSGLRKTADIPLVVVEDGNYLRVLNGGEDKILQPKGERNYLWASVSPDGTRLLFTVAGAGAFISDLDGNIITELGYANAPSWSPDGNWVLFMRDYDDGYSFTASEIFIASADGNVVQQITATDDVIELYPRWSNDGNRIVCASDTGIIYLISLEWR